MLFLEFNSECEKIVSEKGRNIDFLTESAEKLQRTALACKRAAQKNEEKYFVLFNEQKNLDSLYRKAVFQRDDFGSDYVKNRRNVQI